jgi:uncharacterized MAPEG superfamily protein
MAIPAILLDCIAAAAVLIYVPYGVAAYARKQVGFDPAMPRAGFDKLPDYAQRATCAHQNAFETFMVFAAAALMAYVSGVTAPIAGWAAIAFVVSRFFYAIFYMVGIPKLRSLMFGIGTLSTGTLLVLSLLKVN